ncbi:unnamed protein product [Cuscuta epithymum]|uniref:F-box domain-containing protein n=1 Tax=Cuscuta epithymum TaxID=186058 RepID=A0AAV0F9G7_9ASTE|nr:unnamed protein product [Cuscuta epithymum]
MNDQIIAEILVRLPPKSVYRFRAVSKSWNKLTSQPYFIKKYDSRQRPPDGVGLLSLFGDFYCPCNFSHSKNRKKSVEYHSLDLEVSGMFLEPVKFINSSNGLILCSQGGWYEEGYLVLNPVTKRSVSLPPLPPSSSSKLHSSIGLMCIENKSQLSAKYIVVQTGYHVLSGSEKGTLMTVTYSSETGVWVEAKLRVITDVADAAEVAKEDIYLSMFRVPPLVMNGVFHWYDYWTNIGTLTLALYRPDSEAAVLDFRSYDGFGNNNPLYGSSALTRSSIYNGDVLWFALVISETMRVFMLPKGNEQWVLVHTISVESLWQNDTALVTSSGMRSGGKIFLNGLVQVNDKKTPVALIRRKETGRVFLYDMGTKAVQSLPYQGRPVRTEWGDIVHGPEFLAHYPYLQPSSLSTFAL